MHSPFTGHPIGIIMQVDTVIRPPGDVGNASTFRFPVLYWTVPEVDHMVLRDPGTARTDARLWVNAACDLERAGVRAIAGGFGYLAVFQDVMAAAVTVPGFTSALMLASLVSQMVGKRGKVGILTTNSGPLREEYFRACRWSSKEVPVAMIGLEGTAFGEILRGRQTLSELDRRDLEAIVVGQARSLMDRDLTVGAFVFECTNLPPYSAAVRQATGLPVFDSVGLIEMVHRAVTQQTCGLVLDRKGIE